MKTEIDGYTVELTDETGQIDCWVNRGPASASLCLLQGTASLVHHDAFYGVAQPTINKITAWAEAHGYPKEPE